MAKEISNDSLSPCAQDVANAFVKQYYLILHLTPENTHKFYKDGSVMARSGSDSKMTVVSTMKDINDSITSIDYKEFTSKIEIVHAQFSLNEAVLVGVKGHLIGLDKVTKTFTQTFLLAPQSNGAYYVMNDFLFYIDVKETVRSPALSVADVPEIIATTPLAQDAEPTQVLETKKDIEEIPKISDQSDKNVVAKSEPMAKPSSGKNNMVPVPKAVAISQTDPAKTSYASMLAKESEATTPAPVVVRVNPGQQSSTGAPSVSKPASPPIKAVVPTSNGAHSIINSAADAKSIHIRGLPHEITDEELIQSFKKFGAVRERSIRIKRFDDGFCYAFLEFETSKSAQTAVETEIADFRGKKAQIQYKKSSNQNNQGFNRGRSPSTRGGYYNDNNSRVRENFAEGQSGGRNESGRNENYNNQARGSSAGRNGDSYRRQAYQNGGERGFPQGGGN